MKRSRERRPCLGAEWEANEIMILGRPSRRLVVSGSSSTWRRRLFPAPQARDGGASFPLGPPAGLAGLKGETFSVFLSCHEGDPFSLVLFLSWDIFGGGILPRKEGNNAPFWETDPCFYFPVLIMILICLLWGSLGRTEM